ncbi:MAG: pentapeptide repeat-containing protein [Acidobacteriota bacterium]|nr:pentapeptide repeat-containing protein [Acidobacteriota bacterium]
MDLRPILEQKKVDELRKLAGDFEIVGRSRMRKKPLIDSLLAREFSGVRAIWEHVWPPEKKAPTFMVWLFGFYTAVFGLTSGIYENRADRIELRARTIIGQMGNDDARRVACGQIHAVQNMPILVKPEFRNPWSVVQSLFGDNRDTRYGPGVELLRDTVVAWKKKLQGADLRKADLQRADLGGADLQGADLYGADLQGADLRRADLQRAYLTKVDLQRASLHLADLQGADLYGADLQRARLLRADLQGADLRKADLRRANLTEANLQRANLAEANLTNSENLTMSQLQDACIYQSTKLPHYLWDEEHERAILADLILTHSESEWRRIDEWEN